MRWKPIEQITEKDEAKQLLGREGEGPAFIMVKDPVYQERWWNNDDLMIPTHFAVIEEEPITSVEDVAIMIAGDKWDHYTEEQKNLWRQRAAGVSIALHSHFENYSVEVQFKEHVNRLFAKKSLLAEGMVHAGIGMQGEAGECADLAKKWWIYEKIPDYDKMKEEVGDLLFYTQAYCQIAGFTLREAMQHNMEKLAKRYPNGYSDAAAIERKDKA